MNSFVVISIFAAAAIFQMVGALKVKVLYESLCPDSMKFIQKQLYPTYQDLKKYMDVEFVPFGKAHFIASPWKISCQHGPNECLGNTVQACALARYKEKDKQMNFVHCVMSDSNPPTAGPKCAKKLNYDYTGIEECSKNSEGRELLMKYGDKTAMYRPSFVPTVVFDSVYDRQDQADSIQNLRAVICRKVQPKPAECK